MRMTTRFFAGFAVWASLSAAATPAARADAEAAAALFKAGRYVEAARAADQAPSAEAHAVAAKALASAALLQTGSDAAASVAAARRHAEAALAKEPDHIEARLQMAIVLWLEGRDQSAMEGYRKRLPHRGRALIESALDDAPEEPWAHALMGAWHFEVARRGGALGAKIMGAEIAEGARHFYRAMELAPDDAAIATQCAVAFLALDPETYRPHAAAALARALAAEADDAFEAEMRARGAELARHLDAEDAAEVQAMVAMFVEG